MSDLILYSKSEQVFFKVYKTLPNYPKSEKFSLCHQIKEHFINLLKYISLASSVKSKRIAYLQEADGLLQNIKMLMKLSKMNKYISANFYEDVSDNLSEVNRLLVGLFKATKNPSYKSKFSKD